MWQIFFVSGDEIRTLGQFLTELAAMSAAKQVQHGLNGRETEFDINEQNVYLLTPLGKLQRLMTSDLYNDFDDEDEDESL